MSSSPHRNLPPRKGNPSIPFRYSQSVFDAFNKRNATEYEMWKRGINPRTGRSIKIGGKIHKQIGYTSFTVESAEFTSIEGIDQTRYEEETKSLMSKHQQEVELVQAYNEERQAAIEKIGRLRWNETIMFDNTEYGIPEVHQSIHRRDDCLGCMHIRDTWSEDIGRERPFQLNIEFATFVRFECEKCGYESVSCKKQDGDDRSRVGFWWK